MERRLVVKVTVGPEAPERLSQAFTVAGTAISAGIPVSLWLTGEASWYSLPGRAEEFTLEHSASLAGLLEAVLAQGHVTLCTQCAQRREIASEDVIPGVRIAGAATFIAEVMAEGAQALVY
jgi:predicted peroxiredoxin